MYRPHVDFALALHPLLPAAGNLVWSPYSVASALALAAAGARGRTRDEMVAALAPGGDLDALATALAGSAHLDRAEIAVANTLWLRLGLDLRDAYRQAVRGWPGGGVDAADFAAAPEAARAAINDDVAKTTRGLIRELLAKGTIDSLTAAVLVNALYLKVAWAQPFREAATRPAPFHAPGGTRDVPTMHQRERVGYAEAAGWRMVTLPTESRVVVDVLLSDRNGAGAGAPGSGEPGAGSGEPGAGAPPARDALDALYQASGPVMVDLALPRLRVEAGATLNQPLATLGIVTAFTRHADFSGIAEDDIHLSRVVHKAVLRVDERGFEGAAATAVVMRLTAAISGEVVDFHVDRPFYLVIRHADSGAVYFLARVEQP